METHEKSQSREQSAESHEHAETLADKSTARTRRIRWPLMHRDNALILEHDRSAADTRDLMERVCFGKQIPKRLKQDKSPCPPPPRATVRYERRTSSCGKTRRISRTAVLTLHILAHHDQCAPSTSWLTMILCAPSWNNRQRARVNCAELASQVKWPEMPL